MFGFPSLRHVQGSSIWRWMSNFGTCQSRLSIQLNITLATVSSLPQVNVCVCWRGRGVVVIDDNYYFNAVYFDVSDCKMYASRAHVRKVALVLSYFHTAFHIL